MCVAPPVLMFGLGLYGQYKSGKIAANAEQAQAEEAQKVSQFNAGAALINKKQSDLEALSIANAKLEMMNEEMESNDAWFAFLGRETPSELLEYQKRKAYEDIARGDMMSFLQGTQSIMQANEEIRRGNNAIIQGGRAASARKWNSYSNMFSSLYTGFQYIGRGY
tara:strand:+ start:6970 stop:7464 length:495 start_codon:yes stop_codon:yes gene_type:complete